MATLEVEEKIHLRYDGRTYNYSVEDLEIVDNPTNAQIIEAATRAISDELSMDVSLEGFVVDSYPENGLWNVHPQAKFGLK